jgi:hypothetical protein
VNFSFEGIMLSIIFHIELGLLCSLRESTFIMPRGDEDVKGGHRNLFWHRGGGAPKSFSESSRYTEGGAIIINLSMFWSSRGLECSLPSPRIDGLETH